MRHVIVGNSAAAVGAIEAIRQYDKESEVIRFWEFDVFGSVTEGTVNMKGKDLIYTYDYGGTLITDMWQYVDDSTYNFIVGVRENEKWSQIHLQTQFKKAPSY